MSQSAAPEGRLGLSAVWTGSRMVIWGGYYVNATGVYVWLNTGARYDPVMDQWTSTSLNGAPTPRGHSAVWTGKEMMIWGGSSNIPATGNGARYDPILDRWKPCSTIGAPSVGAGNIFWTGSTV